MILGQPKQRSALTASLPSPSKISVFVNVDGGFPTGAEIVGLAPFAPLTAGLAELFVSELTMGSTPPSVVQALKSIADIATTRNLREMRTPYISKDFLNG